MPIPDHNAHGLLPPYSGDPAWHGSTSPYHATCLEICQRFGDTPEHRALLRRFLDFRSALHQFEYRDGFQWVDGPLLEKHPSRSRKPADHLQVVTFAHRSPRYDDPTHAGSQALLSDRKATRTRFAVEHGMVMLDWPALHVAYWTRHWTSYLTHHRETKIWKGLVKIDLNTPADDAAARQYLATATS